MSGRAQGDLYWRVFAKGVDAAPRVATDPPWGRDEARAAHRLVESATPRSGFSVTRLGRDGDGDDVEASLTLPAADEDTARAAATELLVRALPSVTWTQIEVTPGGPVEAAA